MFQKIVSMIKKWVSGRPSKRTAQETAHLSELNSQTLRDPSSNNRQDHIPADVDEETANEVVSTWNLINPP